MAAKGKPVGTAYAELDLDSNKMEQGLKRVHDTLVKGTIKTEDAFKQLGIKSDSVYEKMRVNATLAFEKIASSAKSSAEDRLRAESALTEKLKSLHAQQHAHQSTFFDKIKTDLASVASSSLSTAALATAAFAAIGYSIKSTFEKGFLSVDTFNQSIASMAAMVVSFTQRPKGQTLEEQWKGALAYSTAMVPILEQIAARTLLSGQETTALANAFARSGVFLDAANKKQIESFTRISNALPLMTQGQEIMRQINTEIRSVMNGTNESSSMMLTTLKAIDPEIEKHLKTWRAEGTVLEHIGDLLVGFGPATELLENQWQAVKSTIDTTVTQVLRAGMGGAYTDIINMTKNLNKFLEENRDTISTGIAIAWETVKNTTKAVEGILSGFSPVLKEMGGLTWQIAYGWGGIAAAAVPVGESIGDSVKKSMLLAEMLVRSAKLAADIMIPLNWDLAKAEFEGIKKAYAEFETIGTKTGVSVGDSIEAYAKKITDAKNKTVDLDAASQKFKALPATIDGATKAARNYFDTIFDLVEFMPYLDMVSDIKEHQRAIEDATKAIQKADKATLDATQRQMEDQLKLESDLTDKVNKLTLTEHDYKVWALDKEIEKMRVIAGEEIGLREQISEYHIIKLKEIEDSENKMLKMTEHLAKEMEKTMSTFFFDAMTGKFSSFADFLEGIMNSILKMVSDYMAQIARTILFGETSGKMGGIIGGLIGSLTSTAITSSSGGGNSSGVYNNYGIGDNYAAMGGVYSGPGISAYSGQIVSRPTVFPFARGIGLMGEAGAEAIMPLTRTASGKLGVKAEGGGGVNLVMNVTNNAPAEIKQPKINFDGQSLVLDWVIDGMNRDVNGFRSAMGGR